MSTKVRNGMVSSLSEEDPTEDTTAITIPKHFTTTVAGPRPLRAPGEGHQWEQVQTEGDTRLQAAVIDNRCAPLNVEIWNTGSVEPQA
jgi:hypothetical protein